ncbi:Hypothetical predicted protein [Lecanosticta acicola]|uniref:LicD/FKTN/FKRP nucleotidyltransferase domain-containing protein n=1 Tax=Lecanosticta acicola TaxID=111012 RepID=A0AAI8W0Z6_9PEZI|nr:Hypothetical predicted protein [Lecanosticta acicola]
MKCRILALFAGLICVETFRHASCRPVIERRDADFESVRTRLDHPHVNLDDEPPDKYFHESNFHQHYDGRFADRPLKYDERQMHLSALIRTYLSAMNDMGAIGRETWLMHGTLLGWYWNRRIMPWDSDLDVMISQSALHFLASFHNMTVHKFRLPGHEATRSYMLEINPHYREDGLDRDNRIDARWIDTETGLFIDITTLRRNMTATTAGDSEAMMVKDKHHYSYDDIYPLRQSRFEGVAASIPYAYADILMEEYGEQALSGTDHENHRFDTSRQAWLPAHVSSMSGKYDDG